MASSFLSGVGGVRAKVPDTEVRRPTANTYEPYDQEMDMPAALAEDEFRHEPGPDLLWNESWYLDFFNDDGSLGGYVRMGLYPNLGVTWYWACLVGMDRPLVTVIEHEAPLPPEPGLELRCSGLWAEVIPQIPLEHMTVGLEAFGVGMDDPSDVYGSGWGDRTPLGFDLEWETDGGTFSWGEIADRYEIPCRVHGEILVGTEVIDFDGWGQRDHSWGVRDWWDTGWMWSAGRMDDGTRFHGVVPTGASQGVGYWGQSPQEGLMSPTFDLMCDARLGVEQIPDAATISYGPITTQVRPLAWAPVLLTSPDGRQSRFPRGLCRFETATGEGGLGWVEFNQPPPKQLRSS